MGGVAGIVAGIVALWRARARERHHLATLDHRNLRDIGLSADAARKEAEKPFWRS